MKSVQIKVLRDNLSKYLNLVKMGEVILVRERNSIIAELKKPSPSTEKKTEWEIQREIWIQEGILSPAKKAGSFQLPTQKPSKMDSKKFWKMFEEMRDDSH